MDSIGGFYAGSTSVGKDALSTQRAELQSTISTSLPIERPAVGITESPEAEVELDRSNIALGLLREGLEKGSTSLPLTVLGSCCRLNDRFLTSKQNAFRIGASLGILPAELKSIDVPQSWHAAFSEMMCL